MTSAPATVSVLGLGLMGSALAESLLKAGNRVTVWNRSPAKAEALDAEGAEVAGSAGDAIAASDLTIACVKDHAATLELLSGIPAVGGKTLIQLSTMSPDDSRELAAWAREREMAYLDGSILGVPTTVRDGKAALVYSGPADVFAAHRDVLRALGAPLHLSPEIGAAPVFDRVWYAYSFAVHLAFLQGAAMAHGLGFSLDVYFDTVRTRTPVILGQLMVRGEKISARDYATDDARLDAWADGFEATLALCRETGIDDALPAAVLGRLRRASAAGHGDSDLAAVFETLIGSAAPKAP